MTCLSGPDTLSRCSKGGRPEIDLVWWPSSYSDGDEDMQGGLRGEGGG